MSAGPITRTVETINIPGAVITVVTAPGFLSVRKDSVAPDGTVAHGLNKQYRGQVPRTVLTEIESYRRKAVR